MEGEENKVEREVVDEAPKQQVRMIDMRDVLKTSIMQMKKQSDTCEAKAEAFQEVLDFMNQYNVRAVAEVPVPMNVKEENHE